MLRCLIVVWLLFNDAGTYFRKATNRTSAISSTRRLTLFGRQRFLMLLVTRRLTSLHSVNVQLRNSNQLYNGGRSIRVGRFYIERFQRFTTNRTDSRHKGIKGQHIILYRTTRCITVKSRTSRITFIVSSERTTSILFRRRTRYIACLNVQNCHMGIVLRRVNGNLSVRDKGVLLHKLIPSNNVTSNIGCLTKR